MEKTWALDCQEEGSRISVSSRNNIQVKCLKLDESKWTPASMCCEQELVVKACSQ